MTITRRRLLMLLPAAAIAWDSIIAGTPEESPNYKMTDHWWGMLIDITKCIGCGKATWGSSLKALYSFRRSPEYFVNFAGRLCNMFIGQVSYVKITEKLRYSTL